MYHCNMSKSAAENWPYCGSSQDDLSAAIDQLLEDIAAGRKYMKVYKQMKMYNDPELNPVLYASK